MHSVEDKHSSADKAEKTLQCPLCPKESAMEIKSDQLNHVNTDLEVALGQVKCKCPFTRNGCVEIVELNHLGDHVASCSFEMKPVCSECFKNSKALGDLEGGGKHKSSCTTACQGCQKKVCNADLAIHMERYCSAKMEIPAAAPLPEPSAWESVLVDSKKPASVEAGLKVADGKVGQYRETLYKAWEASAASFGACPIMPCPEILDEAMKAIAGSISLNTDAKKTKGGSIDENIHVQLGLVLEEATACRSLFPTQTKKDAKTEANDNTAACESFMSDEVDGLLMSLGVPKTASDATKIKAMEEEYHRLLSAGQSDQVMKWVTALRCL
jgi:hypothetical protein